MPKFIFDTRIPRNKDLHFLQMAAFSVQKPTAEILKNFFAWKKSFSIGSCEQIAKKKKLRTTEQQ